jgi:hypothetical protein
VLAVIYNVPVIIGGISRSAALSASGRTTS